ncbi:MAG: hypothetical protein L3J20_06495 [Flavobacteriaceae bacterium]|nr:hypothetical protein [Flavobacteriaceae bacterium]
MKKYLLLLICIIIYTNIFAQMITKDNIVGSYQFAPRVKLFAYPNNRFVFLLFATIVNGEWKLKDNTVHFIPDSELDSFILYGRKTTTLKDSTRVIFKNFEDYDNSEYPTNNTFKYVNFESPPKDSVLSMRQVFNDDANCFGSPYIYKDIKAIQKLRFTTKKKNLDKDTEYDVYTFDNPMAYNDFVIMVNLDTERAPFSAMVENGGLLLNSDDFSIKKVFNEPLSEEEVFFSNLANSKMIGDVIYTDKEHSPIDLLGTEFKIEYYGYDKINDLYFNPDLEKTKDLLGFDYSEPQNSELLPYKRMAKQNVLKQTIKINTKPLFIAKCK